MTRRERLERKLEKREEWAEGRTAKAARTFDEAHNVPLPPMGEPIKIGHHSEKRHRAAIAKVDQKMRKAFEHDDMAKHHRQKASGLADQLAGSIFSDDPDAIDQLETKLAEQLAERESRKTKNAEWRKAGRVGECPYQPYELGNLSGRIKNTRDRISQVKRRHELTEQAEASGGVTVIGNSTEPGAWCQVIFAEKPEREIINELKAAGFHWGSGRWSGPRDKLPESVKQIGGAA